MQHLYHHLNTAWNARDEAPERVAARSEEDAASANLSPLLHVGVNRGQALESCRRAPLAEAGKDHAP